MLSREDNALLCEVEPGTTMHAVLKHFWFPIAAAAAVPDSDSDPVKVTALGENYVLFRDSAGRLGLLNELCAHRGASLSLGRVEDGGIRCIYHGWKFDVDGQVMDIPNAKGFQYRERCRQRSYATHEVGNLIWAYFGPAEKQPPFPRIPFLDLPKEHSIVQEVFIDANFIQVMEGLVDSSHLGVLHRDSMTRRLRALEEQGQSGLNYRQIIEDPAPDIEVEDTDFGLHYAAIREVPHGDGRTCIARVTAFCMPFFTVHPSNTMMACVPMSNTSTLLLEVEWDNDKPFDAARRAEVLGFHGVTDTLLDQLGMSRRTYRADGAAAQLRNFHQNRSAMRKRETFTGLPNFLPEDLAVCLSMGPLVDRSIESVVPADQAVVRMRRVLLESARSVKAGKAPRGVRPEQFPRGGLQGPVRDRSDWRSVLK